MSQDFISPLSFGQALCPGAGNKGATDKHKGGISHRDSNSAFLSGII